MYKKKSMLYLCTVMITVVMFLSCSEGLSQETQAIEPEIIQPGFQGMAPSDAIILFDKGALSNFESIKEGKPAAWKVEGDHFTVIPGTGNIQTKQGFGDCQLHIEWRTPVKDVEAGKEGQGSGNSGIYMMSRYELQVLNSYKNKTYPDGQAGSIYGNYPPMVNASLKPGEWQTYDIFFTAPKYKDGIQKAPAYFTVVHNGVLIQNHVPVEKPTTAFNKNAPEGSPKLPLMLQNHGNEVSYRNIWIREL